MRALSAINFRTTSIDFYGFRRGIPAPPTSGRLLGQTLISDRPDRDTLTVRQCGINYIRLAMLGDGAYIRSLRVQYGNSVSGPTDQQLININRDFWLGEGTRWIDLSGNSARCIWNISVLGQSEPGGEQSLMRIFGI